MSAPIVPPRPTRASGNGPTAVPDSTPQVPPRPSRKIDPSPVREEHTRSPLNDPYHHSAASRRRSGSHLATSDVPARPPSVSLPSVGQEGSEYASYDQLPPEAHGVDSNGIEASPQTVNVSANMPLHQPKASVPQSTAKSRISTVTRTDSTQAAAAGIGRARPDDDGHLTPSDSNTRLSRTATKDDDLRRVSSAEAHPLRKQISNNRSTSSLRHSRPGSTHEFNEDHEHEQGIPEIGMQIPLHPNAGDVQAPSPAPGLPQHSAGVGFFNDGSARAHTRRRSGKHQFGPPDSYGLHGHHGYSDHHDQFERDWCAKHPEQAAKEGYNVYGNLNTPRPEHALSTEELNRLVNQTHDVGMGTNSGMIGTPTHDIAFNATHEYTSRMNSPRPSPALTPRKHRPSSGSQPAAESPLRKSFPFNEKRGEDAVENDEDTIHVDDAEFRANKVTGGGPQDGAIDLGPRAGNTEDEGGVFDERGDGMPILASDEVIKRPGSAFMQPAVNPEPHHDDEYYDSDSRPDSRRGSLRVPSRPSSRPSSMHGEYSGGNLYRFMSHEEHHGSGMGTPLEEIEEYEPLFPEDEKTPAKPKPKAATRPGLEHHHFPSQDVWEDAPSSVHYLTTVETPEPPPEKQAIAPPPRVSKTFETPEEEQKRKDNNASDMLSDEKTFSKPHFKAGVQEEMHRPGVQRFPSQDIWEDTPDSMRLVTTVSAPQTDDARSPPDERPTTSAIPTSQDDAEARATTGFSPVMRRPSVPSRPRHRSKLAEEITGELQEIKGKEVPDLGLQKQPSPDKAKAPAIPDRPKPSVPARPARPSRAVQNDGAPLAKEFSHEEQAIANAMPVPKARPAVPARPGGEKIAALKSGFMADLNNRLKIGPREAAPPKEETKEEEPAAPLADARKGRTKGPARRKPAASPSAAAASSPDQTLNFSFSTPQTIFSIDSSDALIVPISSSASPVQATEEPAAVLERVLSANEAANTEEPAFVQPASPERSRKTSLAPVEALSAHPPGAIGHEGDEPEPSISAETAKSQGKIEPGLEAALAEAEPAPTSAEEVVPSPKGLGSADVGASEKLGDAELGRDAAALREKAPEEMNINGHEV